MKKLLFSLFLILSITSYSYSDTVVDGLPSGGGVSEGSDVGFGNITATSISVGSGSAAAPAVAVGGANGIYEYSPNNLGLATDGTGKWRVTAAGAFVSIAAGAKILQSGGCSTSVPMISSNNDADTGVGCAGVDQATTIAGGVEALRNYTTYSEFYPSGTGQVTVTDSGDMSMDGDFAVVGGVAYPNITTVFSNYSVDINDKYVFINASSAARTLYLPDATIKKGAEIRYKKVDALFNTITFDGYSTQTINNNGTLSISFPGNALTILSDGLNWQTVQKTGEVLSFSSYYFSSGTADTYYTGGGSYHANATDSNLTNASPTATHGDANEPAGSHIFWVFGGATSVPDGTVFMNISGTHVDDDGNTINESIVLSSDLAALSVDDYLETTQKWVGQVQYRITCTGTCTTYSADGNTGHAKYADFQDRDFTLRALEVSGTGGATDTGFDLCIKHHNHTGWTYAASGFVPGNGDLACLGTDYGVNDDLSAGGHINWDRNLNTFVEGSDNEGILIEITTTQNNSIRDLSLKYGIVYK